MGSWICVFKTHNRIQVSKTIEKPCVKENKHIYLFSLCFGKSHFCVQIKSNDYCDSGSAKLKYLSSYDCIFNPVHFNINLKGNHFRSWLKIPVSHQDSQTSKEIGADISIFLGSKNILRFLVRMFSKTSIVNYVVFPVQFWQTMSSQMDILRMDFLCFQKCPLDIFLQYHPFTYNILTSTIST